MCLLSKINVLTLFIQIKIYFDSQKWLFYCDLLNKNLIFFEVMCVLIFTLVVPLLKYILRALYIQFHDNFTFHCIYNQAIAYTIKLRNTTPELIFCEVGRSFPVSFAEVDVSFLC